MADDFDDLPQPDFEGTVATDALHTDGDNPNEMTDEQLGLLCDRMRTRGWLGGPIIADTDGLIADGEHRLKAADEIGLSEVPVIQLDVSDTERRLIRQELNKIRGGHNRDRDALEFDRILSDGHADELEELIATTEQNLEELLNDIDHGSGEFTESVEPANDPNEEWSESGTVRDTNEDLSPEHTVTVNLRNDDDLREFEELIGQEVSAEHHNTVWYPPADELDASDSVAVGDVDE